MTKIVALIKLHQQRNHCYVSLMCNRQDFFVSSKKGFSLFKNPIKLTCLIFPYFWDCKVTTLFSFCQIILKIFFIFFLHHHL